METGESERVSGGAESIQRNESSETDDQAFHKVAVLLFRKMQVLYVRNP